MPPRGAIIVGGYVNALGLVRALAARGITVALISNRPFDIAQRSRHVCAHDHLPDLGERPESLIELLEHRRARWRGWALFPTHDDALEILAAHHAHLSRWYRVIAPEPEIARVLLDKELMLGAARDIGMTAPRCYGPATAATAARDELRYPVIVKPVAGHRFSRRFGVKVLVANDRQQLQACVQEFSNAGLEGQVSDLIPGPDSQIFAQVIYMDARAEPRASVTVHKLRQSPPRFGVARVAEIVEDRDELYHSTIELLRRIGFRGIATAEFKLDPRDGSYRFIELNGRSMVYNSLLRTAGVDIAHLAWSDYVLGRPQRARARAWPGVWIHLHADLLCSTLLRQQERLSLGDYLAPYRRPRTFAVWSKADPRPFMAQWSRTMAEAGAAVSRSSLRELVRARGAHTPDADGSFWAG